MNALLCIMNARRIRVCVDAFESLDCDKAWMTGYTMLELASGVHANIVRGTSYDAYVMCSDDCVVTQSAWDAVVRELAAGHPAVTGYCPLLHNDPLDQVGLCKTPIRTAVRKSSYDWYTKAEVLAHPDDPVPTHFMGMSLTGMTRDMWLRFPHRCYTKRNPRGHASDHNLSVRLRDAGVPMVAPKDGWVDHLKAARGLRDLRTGDWRGENLGEHRLIIGDVTPEVRLVTR